MSNMREALASTHHASLVWSERERAIDKVAASGRCDELGVLLWKAKYMSESVAYRKARTILINKVSERFIYEARLVVDNLVDQCLHEFISDMCNWCKGAKEIMAGEKKVVCDACQGHGVRKFTDNERARAMKLALGKVQKMQRHFRFLHELMGSLDRQVNEQMNEQLERY